MVLRALGARQAVTEYVSSKCSGEKYSRVRIQGDQEEELDFLWGRGVGISEKGTCIFPAVRCCLTPVRSQ